MNTDKKIFYVRHSGGVTVFVNNRPSTVSSSHKNFDKILRALKDQDYESLDTMMSLSQTITALGTKMSIKGRKVFVEGGRVLYTEANGKRRELHGSLVDRILADIAKPSNKIFAEALINFMDNIMKNPLKDIRKELYDFLMSGHTPITKDGCFLAYKKVRGDYKDIYSGTMDNSPGSMPRIAADSVDRNRTNTCSVGLHFCSRDYLGHYSGWHDQRVMVVKVNPRNVFAIPTDYNYQKGRASTYYVVGEVNQEILRGRGLNHDVFKDAFVDEDTKEACAPDVTFIKSMKPSLETIGESHGIVKDGKVHVVWGTTGWIPVKKDNKGRWFDITGKDEYFPADVKKMSFETKSVRAGVARAVTKAERFFRSKR